MNFNTLCLHTGLAIVVVVVVGYGGGTLSLANVFDFELGFFLGFLMLFVASPLIWF